MTSKHSDIPVVEVTVFISTRGNRSKATVSAPLRHYDESDQVLDRNRLQSKVRTRHKSTGVR